MNPRTWMLAAMVSLATPALADFEYQAREDELTGEDYEIVSGISTDGEGFLGLMTNGKSSRLSSDNLYFHFRPRDRLMCGKIKGEAVPLRWTAYDDDGKARPIRQSLWVLSKDRAALILSSQADSKNAEQLFDDMLTSQHLKLEVSDECGNTEVDDFRLSGFKKGVEDLNKLDP